MKPIKYQNTGFTRSEVLVVLVSVSLLIAVVLPALSEARRPSRRVLCAMNMHTLGLGMAQYCSDNEGMMPYQYWTSSGSWGTTTLYHGDILKGSVPLRSYHFSADGPINLWCKPWGMGALYDTGIVSDISLFFCPGADSVNPDHSSLNPDVYTDPATGGLITRNTSAIVRVRSSYNFFKNNIRTLDKMASLSYYYDFVSSWKDIAHRSVDGTPEGFHALYGDAHVEFSTNPGALDQDAWGYPLAPADDSNLWYSIFRNPVTGEYYIGNNMPDLSKVAGNILYNWICNESITEGGQEYRKGWRYQ